MRQNETARAAAGALGAMLLALAAAPGFADVKQVRLGVKGATCAT